MFKLRNLLIAGVVTGFAGPVAAQDPLLGQYYGAGVHAFNGGNYAEAQKDLSAAIDAGTKDPRCFYFRGLSFLRAGLEREALADFQKGSELETADINQAYPVAKSLERVQGRERLTLEQYRAQARMVAFARQQKEREARYQTRQRAEQNVMRQLPKSNELPIPGKAGPAPALRDTNPVVDPFGSEPVTKPAGPMPKTGGPAPDPFGADPKPEAPMPKPDAGNDPFGAGNDPKPEVPAPKPEAGNDPFGAGNDSKPEVPAPKPAAGNDPFGADDTKPAPMPKPEMPKPAAGNDPFGATNDPKPEAPAVTSGAKVTTKGLMGIFGSMMKSMAEGDAPPAAPAGPGIGLDLGKLFGGDDAEMPAQVNPGLPGVLPGIGPEPKKGAAADDPFGAPEVMPKKGPAASDDPFKDDADQSVPKTEKPAPKPADDDPFGK